MFGLRWCYIGGGGGRIFVASMPVASYSPFSFARWTLPLKNPNDGRRRWRCLVAKLEPTVRSPDLVELEYAELRLKHKYGGGNVGHVRIRQHVNPLSSSFTVPASVPDWKGVFKDPTLPLMVDIGSAKARDYVCFPIQCVLSSSAAIIDVEQFQIPSLVSKPVALTYTSLLPYAGPISPPTKTNSETVFAKQTFITCEEAVIEAAAAEAVALAKAAVKVANDAFQMAKNRPYVNSKILEDFPSEADILRLERVRLSNTEHVSTVEHTRLSAKKQDEEAKYSSRERDTFNFTDKEEHEIQHMQNSKITTVRSLRRNERRARREGAGEKVSINVASLKSRSSGRKKRSPLQEIDYSDPLRHLRGITSNSKLLTSSEELELSKSIQDLLKLEKLQVDLTKRNGCQPTFGQWAAAVGVDERTLRKRLDNGILSKNKMIKSNVRLVISIAKKYQGAGLNLQDLVQEGCRGLVKGAEKFDASKGFKFSTYAHWWIKQAVRKSLSDQSRTIRLPVHMVEATYRVKEARKQLYTENGRYPNIEEVAEATGLSMRRLTAVMLAPKAPRSLDQKIGIHQNLKPSEVIAHPDAETAEATLMKELMRRDLDRVLDSLSPRENQVVRMRFGLGDGRIRTLQEIGECMGVSRERIRQIESCAFRKLKSKKRSKNLQQYLLP